MEAVMIRYGEIFLKSETVKRRYISIMTKNIGLALESEGLTHRIETYRGRIMIYGDEPHRIATAAAKTFGVVSTSVCTVTTADIEGLAATAVEHAERHLEPGMSFAVRARRSGVEGFSSQELAAAVGSAVLDRIPEARVDLTAPDYEIFVEAREYGGLVYDEKIPGPGGLPYGTQGEVMALLSEGIDSPVASWLMMRRGCLMVHVNMHGGRFGGADAKKNVLQNHARLSLWIPGHALDLLVVEMEPFFAAITALKEPRYRCVLCKRFMLRVASILAKERDAAALVSGDNLGQVASQTLANMAVIAPAATVPVLRPLIGLDKEEVVDRARAIGTFEAQPGKIGCTVAPRYPSTAAPAETILKLEEEIGAEGLAERAVGTVRRYRAKNGVVEKVG
ncbi:tRNA 4-thiouridine(8) synthase ThiI [Methanoculleus sp. FWC-SCC3]|uniref:Probable tRNA sulfurtransferase n=1 Tax=Methanoculleus methanifontis TaxID=2584086 RepID=A0ABT8M4R5_9EURY|nr:tRNA uracil 4-sulfurtransferase ThiI [Methanoculleus sp. FWC-SCC3]MDN7013600.1 tRNA 4-thiouridine(8) synthase ThiI [Methanoculleus sp. FWC-SCC3]